MELIWPRPTGGISYRGPTDLQRALEAMLEEEGLEFTAEWTVPGSSYRLDAYVAATRTGYEADGPFHCETRDRRRDAWIIANSEVERIVRLTYRHLAPWVRAVQ